MALVFEQLLNGFQFGIQLFLVAAGLTLIFGIMNFINLAHGSLFMIGAFFAAWIAALTGSFLMALIVAVPATALVGWLMEVLVLRNFYKRSHLDQVLVTFGMILVFNETTRLIGGAAPLTIALPEALAGSVTLPFDVQYPIYRLFVLVAGLLVAAGLYLVIAHTRIGMWVRAGTYDRDAASMMGVNVQLVFAAVFATGAALAGFAGILSGPITAVQVGMGEPILILSLVVTVVGGVGSIKGAFVAALLIGLADTFGRILLPPALGSMAIFLLMSAILAWRPKGLFVTHG